MPYMTEISESEKEKKKREEDFSGRTHAVVVVITFFLLSSHVTSHLPILLKFSYSALPFYFISLFSCFKSYYYPLFFFYIMCPFGLFMFTSAFGFFIIFFLKSRASCTVHGTWTVHSGLSTVTFVWTVIPNLFFYYFQFSTK